MIHFTHHYLLYPQHRVTVDLVGCGGTGSQVLSGLARINESLKGLNHPGLFVRAWDQDVVTQNNIGRQLFSPADIGICKATVLISRINRFFGTDWEANNKMYLGTTTSNILITCVDTAATRLDINESLKKVKPKEPYDQPYYWLDFGNLQKTGQIVLGTLQSSSMPSRGVNKPGTYTRKLKTVVQMFPQMKRIKEDDLGPSCSLADALSKQDLFINSTLAQLGCNLLWKLFKDQSIDHHGCYVNLETLTVNPIKIK